MHRDLGGRSNGVLTEACAAGAHLRARAARLHQGLRARARARRLRGAEAHPDRHGRVLRPWWPVRAREVYLGVPG